MSRQSVSAAKKRAERRAQGLCADCAAKSKTYRCAQCRARTQPSNEYFADYRRAARQSSERKKASRRA